MTTQLLNQFLHSHMFLQKCLNAVFLFLKLYSHLFETLVTFLPHLLLVLDVFFLKLKAYLILN